MKNTIKGKILSRMLWISLASIIVLSIVAFIQMNNMGNTAAADSGDALREAGQDQLLTEAKARAAMSNEKLVQFQNQAIMVRDMAESIYQHPEDYSDRKVQPALAENAGKIVTQQFFDTTYEETPETLAELRRLANLQDVLAEIALTIPAIGEGGIYIATETGIMFMADKQSDQHAGDFLYDHVQSRPWYSRAKETGEVGWTDVMTDKFGRGLGIVCSAPVYDASGTLKAVVGVGAMLIDLNEIVNTPLGETGYSFITNQKGAVILSSRDGELAVSKLNVDEAGKAVQETLAESPNGDLSLLSAEMQKAEEGVSNLIVDGNEVFAGYAPIDTLGWSFGTVITQEEILRAAVAMELQISQTAMVALGLLIAIAVLIVAVVILSGTVMATSISKPIQVLQTAAREISAGKLYHHVDIHTGDELETLGKAFNKMTRDLMDYMINLKNVTKEKERIGAELNVATQIQASMLPSIFPAFPEREEFDIFATMQPAKEVGGDFYDFFLIDPDHLVVVMADVSGKGVPAALFMVIAKTLIKNHAQNGIPASEVFNNANAQLCEGNEAGLFVTAWMGVLEISTGKFTYVNAGHNPPLLKRKNGTFEYIHGRPGFVLAGMEGMRFKSSEMELFEGDILYLYTDGVTEATDTQDQLYGEPRLLEVLNQNMDSSLPDILRKVREDIDVFVKGAPQFDDITMLALKISPPKA